jgi:hypothetical protein
MVIKRKRQAENRMPNIPSQKMQVKMEQATSSWVKKVGKQVGTKEGPRAV